MPLRRWFGGSAGALLLLSISLTAATGIAAPAATATAVAASAALPGSAQELPVVPIYQVVPSPVRNRVYVATGTDDVLVADLVGRVTARIGGLPGNHGLDVAPDGTLWVALPDSREIVAVDPDTLAVRTRHPVPHDACPGDVAATGRFVAFGFSCFFFASQDDNPSNSAGVGVLDTVTGQVSLIEPYLPGVRPIVATSPALPNRVYAVDYNAHSTALAVLDVSTGAPRWVTSHYLLNESVFDLAVSPDGQTVAIATYFDDVQTFSAGDLTPAVTYPLDCNGLSLAWSTDSTMLAVGCNHHTDAYHVAVFARGVPTPAATVPLYGEPHRLPYVQGLVMAADKGSVLVATKATFEHRAFLEPMGLRPSTLTVTGPASGTVTKPLTLVATLIGAGAPAPPGAPLDIARENPVTGAVTALGTVYTDGNGVAAFTDVPPEGGTVRYSARLGAHASFLPAYGRSLVEVAKLPTPLSISFEPGKLRHGVLPGTIVVTLGPTGDERLVMITATTAAGTQVVTVQPVPVSDPLRVTYYVTEPATLTVTYQGNAVRAPASASISIQPIRVRS
jgi:hypothetical protein